MAESPLSESPLFDPVINTEYMPSQRVPGAEAIYGAWASRSAAVREQYPPQLLRYGPGEHEVIDVFEPPSFKQPGFEQHSKARGTLLFIHGGYWLAFYKDDFSYLAPPLLNLGWRVAIMSYDLAPAVTLRHIVRQTRRATSALAQAYADPLVVAGHSAGGHLAAMLHATDWNAPEQAGLTHPDLHAGIGISGLYDLLPLRFTELQPDLQLTEQEARELSPVWQESLSSAPFIAAVGALESDAFREQSRALAQAWGQVLYLELPGRHHFDAPEEVAQVLGRVLGMGSSGV